MIDLTFLSQQIYSQTIFCGPEPAWAIIPDHIPIRITLDLAIYPRVQSKYYAVQRLDLEGLSQLVQDSPWDKAPEPLEALQDLLSTSLPRFCPYTQPSPYASHLWSPKAAELLAGCREARYQYQDHGHNQDHQRQILLAKQLKKEIQRVS